MEPVEETQTSQGVDTTWLIAEIRRPGPLGESHIPGVVVSRPGIGHEDDRRAIIPLFNGAFTAAQAKLALMKRDGKLGGHYHEYGELFFVVQGTATFTLLSVDNPDLREVHKLEAGSALTIPERIAHKAEVGKDTILLGFTEEPYIDAQSNDINFDI